MAEVSLQPRNCPSLIRTMCSWALVVATCAGLPACGASDPATNNPAPTQNDPKVEAEAFVREFVETLADPSKRATCAMRTKRYLSEHADCRQKGGGIQPGAWSIEPERATATQGSATVVIARPGKQRQAFNTLIDSP